MVRKAIIPAAGHGTRLLPLTRSHPKEMLPCGPAPVIAYVLEELKAAGITDILLISRSGKPSLEDYVFSAWPGACVVRQAQQKGLGHAVLQASRWVGQEPFVVALGDTIIESTLEESPLCRMLASRPADNSSLVLVRHVSKDLVSRYGIVSPQDSHWIEPQQPPDSQRTAQESAGERRAGELIALQDIIEKPAPEEAPSDLAIAGRYLFSADIFPILEETAPGNNGEIQLTDAMKVLCSRPGGLFGICLVPGERRFDIGGLDTYYEAFAALSTRQGHGTTLDRGIK